MKKDQDKQDKHEPAPTWQEVLRVVSRCPLCRSQFGQEAVKILEARAGTHLAHITCPKCLNAMMAVIVVSEIGMGTVGAPTDLMAEEAMRIKSKGAITEEDVLCFYLLIEKQKNFEQMF